jgi:dephospho-CoA kinase
MLIALTGGIGSGKSTVAKRWVELGATEVDADVLAREVVAPGTDGLRAVAERFGEDLVTPEGSLNRGLLAQRAFSSEQSRLDLEAILHPRIQKLALETVSKNTGVTVYTIPLLVETTSPLKFDTVVTVSCPEEVRLKRLTENRGMAENEAKQRISAQATDQQRESKADHTLHSDCSLEELLERATALYARITA